MSTPDFSTALRNKHSDVRFVVYFVALSQIISTASGFRYYSATIVQMSGISNLNMDIWMAAVTSGVNFVCTFIGIYLVEKIGRRRLLLGSMVGKWITDGLVQPLNRCIYF